MGLFGGSSPSFNFTPEDVLSLGNKGTQVALNSQRDVLGQEQQLFPELTAARNVYGSRLNNPMNEAELADTMSRFSANAGLRSPGGMNSPGTMLNNVFGVEAQKRGIQDGAITGLESLFAPLRLTPIQPGQGFSGALQQDQLGFQTAQMNYQSDAAASAKDAQGKAALLGLGLAAAAPFAAPMLAGGGAGAGIAGAAGAGGMGGGMGSMFPSLTSMFNPAKAGSYTSGSFTGMTPKEVAGLRLSLAQGGFDLGRNLAPLF